MPGISDILTGLLGMFDLSEGLRGAGENRGSTAADIADPFRMQRGQYQQPLADALSGDRIGPRQLALAKLLGDPGSFEMDPGAQFAMQNGLEGVARHGNAMFGTTRSGNTAIELEKYATGFAGEQFGKRVDQLTRLTDLENNDRNAYIEQLMGASGARTGSPAAAAQAYLDGFKTRDMNLAGGVNGLGGLLDGLFGGLGSLFGGLGKGAGGLGDLLKGFGGTDFSGLNLTGSTDDFLASIGLGGGDGYSQFGADPDMMQRFRDLFSFPGGDGGLGNLDLGDVSPSTTSLLDDLGSGIFGDP